MEVGSRVRYRREFLRNIGCFTGDMPAAKGVITGIKTLGATTLAEIKWDWPDVPPKVNTANLEKLK